jgi:hypothetical protein
VDEFLVVLLLIVLAPLIIREYRALVWALSKHGTTLLDYLDRANAPLIVRAILRWLVGPLGWLAKQLNREKAVSELLEPPEMPEIEEPAGEAMP